MYCVLLESYLKLHFGVFWQFSVSSDAIICFLIELQRLF